MIDHVSIGVSDLTSAVVFYEPLLLTLGHQKLVEKSGTVGFGKKYPEFWLNHRPNRIQDENNGAHVCLRCSSVEVVLAFYEKAIIQGAKSSGRPGLRVEYHDSYYAAFIIDHDGNKIEVVTFVS